MNEQELKKILKKEIVPYLIGLRNEISEQKTSKAVINVDGQEIHIAKGDDGKTPLPDVDYPSEKTIFDFIKSNLPKRGKDYFTEKDIKDIAKDVLALLPSKAELKGDKGDDGVVDYSLIKELATPLIDSRYKLLKLYVDELVNKTLIAIKENQIPELSAEQIRNKLESLKGNARLDAKAIKGLEKYVNLVISQSGGAGAFYDQAGYNVYISNGTV